MTGNAVLGTDYVLTGSPNQVTIPAGQTSAQITLTAETTKTSGQEKARLNLMSGSGYTLAKGKAAHAGVTIRNR